MLLRLFGRALPDVVTERDSRVVRYYAEYMEAAST